MQELINNLNIIKNATSEVYEAGQENAVDADKIIEKSVSGNRFVTANDVSEVRHSVEIKVSSDCGISVCGKNQLNPVFDTQLFVSTATGSVISNNTSGYSAIVKVTPNTVYTISGICTGMNSNTLRIAFTEVRPDAGVVTVGARVQLVASIYKTFSFTTPSNCNYVLLMTGTSTIYDYTSNELQLEQGEYATPYEPYIEPKEYTTQNGTITIPSISPYMTVIADSDVDITMNYRKSYGVQTEYDRFWDAYQDNGNRTSYFNCFSGHAWNNATFKPKYDIKPTTSGYGLFWQSKITGDLDELLQENGVVLDTSKCTSAQNIFNSTLFSAIGVVDCSSMTSLSATFQQTLASAYNTLKTIRLLKLKSDGTNTFSNVFNNNNALESITIEGVIGKSFDIHFSPLNKVSIMSIYNALSTTATGQTVSLSKTAVNTAFETSAGAADGSTSTEWTNLVATKSNWTFSLS